MLEVPDVDFIRTCGVVVFVCFIAAWTCAVVNVILVVYLCVCVLCVLCLNVLVNCLLNAFAICGE